jgi:hypothetical protein
LHGNWKRNLMQPETHKTDRKTEDKDRVDKGSEGRGAKKGRGKGR